MSKRGITPAQAEQMRVKKGIGKGTKFRTVRVSRGMSQSELAEVSGIPKRTVQHYDLYANTVDNARLSTLCSLCEALKCSIPDIIDDKQLIERFNKVKGE